MGNTIEPDELLFEVATRLGFQVRVTRSRWNLIVRVKHPAMAERELSVRKALEQPDEIRESRIAAGVYLFYAMERKGRWICAVVRKLNGEGFLITAYPTDAIKEGRQVWTK